MVTGIPERLRRRLFSHSPQGLLVLGFAALILIGTVLLLLPVSHVPGRVGFVEALFTSTSAVCVTGLVVVDTARDFTLCGQIVILFLIQLGGLGVMTFAALVLQVLGRRLSLSGQAALHDSLSQRDMAAEFRPVFRRVLTTVVSIEAVGTLSLFLSLLPSHQATREAAWSALFHAVSAFCNAGFSVYSENLMHIRDNWPALIIVMVLIVLGGLGHVVLTEIWGHLARAFRRGRSSGSTSDRSRRPRGLSLHARVVLATSSVLIVAGAAGLLAFGLGGPRRDVAGSLFDALFQSVTARTAGFNTLAISGLPTASLVLLSFLMFIGGSPGSCAGGVKTTSLAIYVSELRALFAGRRALVLLGRRLSDEVVTKAGRILMLAAVWNLIGIVVLAALESERCGLGLERLVFEQMSAFGTVGLSADVTGVLSTASRLWIIATMFVGRLGPLTVATWVERKRVVRMRYPEGRLMIG